jgi:cytochrome c biogenesis protein CcmG, thiol:disulfide interchange protein DsbE
MNSWLKLALLVVTAVIVTQLLVQKRELPRGAGKAAPPLALHDLSGRPVDLATLRGKVVAVNFWATWCGPCRMEIPDLAEVWKGHQDRCFELLGVAEESGREDIAAAAPRIPYPILVDADAKALDTWDVSSYPTTFLVDADGNVRDVFRGVLGRDELTRAIRPLLPATCPRS